MSKKGSKRWSLAQHFLKRQKEFSFISTPERNGLFQKALWIDKDRKKYEYEIETEERLLAKKVFKHILKSWKKPSFRSVSMLLDSKCALLEKPKKAKAFDLWIRLSTHERRKPIYLPVGLHEYFKERGGKLTSMVQISEDGTLRLVKEIERKDIVLS